MKIGSKVELVKDIPYDGGVVKATTIGEVCNIVVMKDETIILFNPMETTEIYAVNIKSVKKAK